MTQLADLVTEWREINEERKELERLAEDLKKGPEAQAEAAILEYLRMSGQQAARLPNGGGTVALKTNVSVWVADAVAACQAQFNQFKEADAEGRPLTDELLFHQRASKGLALKMAEADLAAQGLPVNDFNNLNAALAKYGFKAVATESLSFTKR